jgi:hypothetical protein
MIVQAEVYRQRRRARPDDRGQLQNVGENFTAFSVWLVLGKPETLLATVLELFQRNKHMFREEI